MGDPDLLGQTSDAVRYLHGSSSPRKYPVIGKVEGKREARAALNGILARNHLDKCDSESLSCQLLKTAGSLQLTAGSRQRLEVRLISDIRLLASEIGQATVPANHHGGQGRPPYMPVGCLPRGIRSPFHWGGPLAVVIKTMTNVFTK
jgi:hypothetical protein